MDGKPALTFVAIIVGLLGAVLIATAVYFNNTVAHIGNMVGNHLPIIIFGPLLLVLVFGNALGWLFRVKWPRRATHLSIIMIIAMSACYVPGSSMMGSWTTTLEAPFLLAGGQLSWAEADIFSPDYTPPVMLPDAWEVNPDTGKRKADEDFAKSLRTGAEKEDRPIPLEAVAWRAWRGPLQFWMPLAGLLGICAICLALIVHRTWSRHERLNYPIARFANTLMDTQGTGAEPPVLRQRLFWIGLLIIFLVHVINGAALWTDKMVTIPREFSFFPLLEKFPWWLTHWQAWRMFNPELFPIALAFGFIIASDVAFSVGISQILFLTITTWMIRRGVPLHGTEDLGGPVNWQRAGSSIAMVLIILYTGRRYYWQVLRSAATFRYHGEVQPYVAWACRVLVLCVAGLMGMLMSVGLDPLFAVLVVLLAIVAFVIQSRIITESGMIFAMIGWIPSGVLFGLFGAKAFGPEAMIISSLFGVVFLSQLQECLMPFVLNALRIGEKHEIKPKRASWLTVAGFATAMAVAVPFALWVDHNYGTAGKRIQSAFTFNAATSVINELSTEGLAQAKTMNSFERLVNINPDPRFFWAFGIGFVAVLVVASLRLRFARWPVHPILFLMWGTQATNRLAPSFFLGWIIKQMVTRLGGTPAFRKTRVLMYGVIAGDLMGGLLWMVVLMIRYIITKTPVPQASQYKIFPW